MAVLRPDCEQKTSCEQTTRVEGSLTHWAAREICRRVGQDGSSVAQMAREFGVSWATAMNCVRRHGEPLVDDDRRLAGVVALGLDEHKMLAAGKDHFALFVTSMVDLATGRLLDVVRGRSGDDVAYWLTQMGGAWRQKISAVAIDPHRGYANGLLRLLPHVTITVDHFHSIKLANAVIDDARQRVQRETTGHRGRNTDPLYGVRRLMTRGWERLSDRQHERLSCSLAAGDPEGEIDACILGKELLRESYAAPTLRSAHWRLVRFYAYAADADVPELTRLATTISA